MIHKARIQGFKCFRDILVQDLKRVNLLAGKNNVGKTAFLEAMCLLLGHHNPSLPLQLCGMRGIRKTVALDAWGWLFAGKAVDREIEITATFAEEKQGRLRIALRDLPETRLDPSELDAALANTEIAFAKPDRRTQHLVMEYTLQDSAQTVNAVAESWVEGSDIRVKAAEKLAGEAMFMFLAAHMSSSIEDPQMFSALSEVGKDMELLEPLRVVEPRLERLSLQMSGDSPVISGDIGIGRLVPMAYLGAGTGRLLSMLLVILSARGGVVLIDEIEGGFHHTAMKDVWKALSIASERSDVQLFATTHSLECIRAAHEAFEELGNYDFCMQRLDRRGNDVIAISYDEQTLDTALASELEVR